MFALVEITERSGLNVVKGLDKRIRWDMVGEKLNSFIFVS